MNNEDVSEYIEYTIKIRDETHTLSEKHDSYESILISKNNFKLKQQVNELAARFLDGRESEDPPEVVISFKTIWQS